MKVTFGTQVAMEGYRDPASDDPDLVRYRALPGNRETVFTLPDDMKLREGFNTVVDLLKSHHMLPDEHVEADVAEPLWVESDSAGMVALLVEEFPSLQEGRPDDWEEVHDEPGEELPIRVADAQVTTPEEG